MGSKRTIEQPSFPFDGIDMEAQSKKKIENRLTGAIIDVCWKNAAALLDGAMSFETWKARNLKAARLLAHDNWDPDTVAEAILESGKYMLARVQDFLVEQKVREKMPRRPRYDGKTWWDPDLEMWRGESPSDNLMTLAEIHQLNQKSL